MTLTELEQAVKEAEDNGHYLAIEAQAMRKMCELMREMGEVLEWIKECDDWLDGSAVGETLYRYKDFGK